MAPFLAQIGLAGSIGHLLIVAIVIAAIIGIFLVVARQAGIVVPQWVITILWIVLAALVGIVAIKFLLSAV